MTPDQFAALAASLRDNDAFQRALDSIRQGAVDALCTVNADDKNSILKAQATVSVVDDIRSDLDAFIRAGKPKDAPGIA